jgi:hypothetical protein
VATRTAVVDFDTFGWVGCAVGDVINTQRSGHTESVLEDFFLVGDVRSHDVLGVPSLVSLLTGPTLVGLVPRLRGILPVKRSSFRSTILEFVIIAEATLLIGAEVLPLLHVPSRRRVFLRVGEEGGRGGMGGRVSVPDPSAGVFLLGNRDNLTRSEFLVDRDGSGVSRRYDVAVGGGEGIGDNRCGF